MKQLVGLEQGLLDAIVTNMAPQERRSYLTYLQGAGFPVTTLINLALAELLYDAGWITEKPDLAAMSPVYLTKEAWAKFALDEWEQIEEEALKKVRGPQGGSW